MKAAQQFGKTCQIGGFIFTADPELAKEVFRAQEHSLPRGSVYRIIGNLVPWTDGILFKVRKAPSDSRWCRRAPILASS